MHVHTYILLIVDLWTCSRKSAVCTYIGRKALAVYILTLSFQTKPCCVWLVLPCQYFRVWFTLQRTGWGYFSYTTFEVWRETLLWFWATPHQAFPFIRVARDCCLLTTELLALIYRILCVIEPCSQKFKLSFYFNFFAPMQCSVIVWDCYYTSLLPMLVFSLVGVRSFHYSMCILNIRTYEKQTSTSVCSL
jgi:hypothetical protein